MDIEYLLWLQTIRQALGSYGDLIFNAISFLGIASVGVVAIIYWCVDKQKGKFLLACFTAGASINSVIKNSLCVYRPWKRDARIVPSSLSISSAGGYSCPSGHTMSAMSVYGGIALQERKNKKVKWGMIFLILIIAFSRNFLGVHTLQDVLLASAEGILVLFCMHKLFVWYGKKQPNDKIILGVGLVLAAICITYTLLKAYPMTYENGVLLVDPISMQADGMKTYGMFVGALIGWFLEKKYVLFSTEHLDTKKRILRLFIGLISTAAFYYGISFGTKLFLDIRIVKFLSATFAALGAVFIAPWIFKKIEKD